MRRLLTLVAALLALAAAPAWSFFQSRHWSGNLDGDAGVEQVRTVKVPDAQYPSDDSFAQTAVNVSDQCPSGPLDVRIAGPQESLGSVRLLDADTRPGREVLVDLRSGAAGRVGEARLVAWRASAPGSGACARPHDLFRYSSTRPTRRPAGAEAAAGFRASVKELERRFGGRELRLDEFFTKRGEALCCPSIRKSSYYRFDRRRDRYARYATRTTRR